MELPDMESKTPGILPILQAKSLRQIVFRLQLGQISSKPDWQLMSNWNSKFLER